MDEMINVRNGDLGFINEKYQLKELIYAFLKEKAESTQRIYQSHLSEFFRFIENIGIGSIKSVRYAHLVAFREYLLSRNLADNTLNVKLATVKSFFSFLSKPMDEKGQSFLSNNIAVHVKKQKSAHYDHSQTFDISLFKQIINSLDEDNIKELRDKIIFLVLGYTALRKSEILQLKVSSIKRDNDIMVYKVRGKGGKIIEKEFPNFIFELIQKLIDGLSLKLDDYLFSSLSNNSKNRNKQLSNSALNKLLESYLKKFGVSEKYRIHSIRSMSAIEVYNQTRDIILTQNHLNHSNVSTTQIYMNKMKSKKIDYYSKMFN